MNIANGLNKFLFITCFFLLTFLMMSTNIASAIYPLYKANYILTSFQVTKVFSAYIFGLIPMLIISSWLAKKIGIRTILIISVIIAAIGILIIGFGANFYSLCVGRILQGISIGLSAGNIASSLIENEPSRNPNRASLATGLAMTIGGGGGPIIGAIIAENTLNPTLFPYLFIFFLLISIIPFLFFLPNIKYKQKFNLPNIPVDIKRVFYTCSFVAFLCWSITAMFLSLIPVALGNILGGGNLVYPALAASSILIISGIVQILAIKLNPKFNIYSGFILLIISGVILLISQFKSLPFLIILCSIISGLGHGLTFLGVTRLLNSIINYHVDKPKILSSYNIFIYLGVGIPTLIFGSLTIIFSIKVSISFFAIYMVIASFAGIKFINKLIKEDLLN